MSVVTLIMAPDNRADQQKTAVDVDEEEGGRHHRVHQKTEMFQQKTTSMESVKFEQKSTDIGEEERRLEVVCKLNLTRVRPRTLPEKRSQPTRMLTPVLALPLSMQKRRSQPTRMATPALDRFPVALPLVMQKKGSLPGS